MVANKITLNIGGKDRVFHLGLGFIGYLLDEEKIGYVEFASQEALNPFKWVPIKMYYSLRYNFIRLEQEDKIDFTLKDIVNWIDETDLATIKNFSSAYLNSIQKDVPVDTDKKKVKAVK
jgi:hypothetical protein